MRSDQTKNMRHIVHDDRPCFFCLNHFSDCSHWFGMKNHTRAENNQFWIKAIKQVSSFL